VGIMKMLSVRLDDKEAAALRELCEQTGLTQSQLVKKRIAELARSKTGQPGVLAQKLGVYGCFDGGRNLSEQSGKEVRKVLRAKSAR
jgi:8-oxo-dGTP pyrophosphatase MutT (NUDIX family)